MRKTHDAAEMMRLATETGLMALEAQVIVAMRLAGMAGWWNVTKGESRRMVTEKAAATQAMSAAVGKAMLLGATPAGIALAAMAPVRVKTTANARRLLLRGVKAR